MNRTRWTEILARVRVFPLLPTSARPVHNVRWRYQLAPRHGLAVVGRTRTGKGNGAAIRAVQHLIVTLGHALGLVAGISCLNVNVHGTAVAERYHGTAIVSADSARSVRPALERFRPTLERFHRNGDLPSARSVHLERSRRSRLVLEIAAQRQYDQQKSTHAHHRRQ